MNGRPRGPIWRYVIHFRYPWPSVLPLATTYFEHFVGLNQKYRVFDAQPVYVFA